MDFAKFMERIELCPEGIAIFNDLDQRTSQEELQQAFDAYDAGDESFASFLQTFGEKKNVTPQAANLYFYIRFLTRTYAFYQEKGISDDVFYATMKSFAWACLGCLEKEGCYGIRQVTYRSWYRRNIDGTLFHLGRLQFEIFNSIYAFDLDGHHINEGDVCIYVHIPGGTPLDFEECDAAYDMARAFFKKHFQIDPVIFYCGSWLLHPWMQDVLPENSRIIRFQKRFQLVEVAQDETVIRNWLFDHSDAPFDELPVKTSLHKEAVHRLKNGLPIGYARGFHF